MAAIQQGDAFLSRLEGEWWLRFIGEGGTTRSAHHARVGTARPIPSASSRVRTQTRAQS